MEIEEFIKTIYVGDRACKGLLVDAWGEKLKINVDLISRVRHESGQWNYYTEEDITDGAIVLSGLRSIRLDPPGPLPNDFINRIEVERIDVGDEVVYKFLIRVSSVDGKGNSTEVLVTALALDAHLEDPLRPGVEIR